MTDDSHIIATGYHKHIVLRPFIALRHSVSTALLTIYLKHVSHIRISYVYTHNYSMFKPFVQLYFSYILHVSVLLVQLFAIFSEETSMLRFRINEILDEQERSAYWLAQKLDMDYHNVKKLVDGDATMVKLSTLEKLTDTLKVNIDDLFEIIP